MAKEKAVVRVKRTPVSGARDILTVRDKDPNYVYRWVNSSVVGRVLKFQDGGYEVVQANPEVGQNTVDKGTQLGSTVQRQSGGSVLLLMRIKKEWYDEDQAAKMEEVDALEATMKQEAMRDRYGSFSIDRDRK